MRGASAFMRLAAMALDRYVTICRPVRYTALVPPLLAVGRRAQIKKICDMYSLIRLSCTGNLARFTSAATVLLAAAFALFSFSSILFVCLSRAASAAKRCVPLLQRRLQAANQPASAFLTSFLVVLVPTVLNPVVYGLNMIAITNRLLLGRRKTRLIQNVPKNRVPGKV
ncbi:hypothetical protein CRENBAI_003932 [Crenichthys baileyi]|uniref:G-protein coupled receptors family 1 profile domain-containing protein n=1 Tax=Crenichthys baileyi TaxID=28760 RepID=A0AAV9SFY6_9TELE